MSNIIDIMHSLTCSRVGCRISVAEDTVDVPIRLLRLSVLTLHCSRALWHNLQPASDRCLQHASHLATGINSNDPCYCHHFSPFMSPGNVRVVQILPQEHSAFILPCTIRRPHCRMIDIVLLSPSLHTRSQEFLSSIQVFCCKAFTVL